MTPERPIIFSGEMVRAILEGRKTQTRRVIKPQIEDAEGYELRGDLWYPYNYPGGRGERVQVHDALRCPYGVPSDRLYVRETWTAVDDDYQGSGDICSNAEILYRADGRTLWRNIPEARRHEWFAKLAPLIARTSRLWRPSIHMPKFAARIWLKVASIRAERLQEITIGDILAEGVDLHVMQPSIGRIECQAGHLLNCGTA